MPTLSLHIGNEVNHRHNTSPEYREHLQHVDHDRTYENEILIDRYDGCRTDHQIRQRQIEIISDLVPRGTNKTISELIEEYNKTVSRPCRMTSVEKEMNKTQRTWNGTLPLIREKEMILQLGNRNSNMIEEDIFGDMRIVDPIARQTQIEYLEEAVFQINKYLTPLGVTVTQASLHLDETTPHIHLDFFAARYVEDKERGLKVTFSLNEVLSDINFKGFGSGFAGFRNFCNTIMEKVAQEKNITIDRPDQKFKNHTDPSKYRKENAAVKTQIQAQTQQDQDWERYIESHGRYNPFGR